MNNKTGLILRLILGGYLVFLGVSVIVQAVQTKPSDLVMKVLFGVLFIAVGGAYAIVQIKKVYHIVKEETEDGTDNEKKDSAQPLFEKPQHDEALYRTAPMPSEEISKKIPAEVTDLRENMKRIQEAEKEVKEKEQAVKPVETNEEKAKNSQLEIQIEEKRENTVKKKDPVNLAIEIMRDENEEMIKKDEADEELEKDYEEK